MILVFCLVLIIVKPNSKRKAYFTMISELCAPQIITTRIIKYLA